MYFFALLYVLLCAYKTCLASPNQTEDKLQEGDPGNNEKLSQPSEALEHEMDNQENILTQLLGDYDKVKALSEGSDCRCKCVVRPLSRSACRLIEEGSATAQDFYTVETVTSGPDCKCACIAPPSALNPCEGDFRLKKLQSLGKGDNKLSTVMELLEGAFYGMDLLKLHSVTTKLLHRVESIEKMVSQSNIKETFSLENTQVKERPLYQHVEKTKRLGLMGDTAAAYAHTEKNKERIVGSQDVSRPLLKRSQPKTGATKDRQDHQTSQRVKMGPPGMVVRGITYYKSDDMEEVDMEENLTDAEVLSGDGSIDMLIEDQLLKYKAPPTRSNERAKVVVTALPTAASESGKTWNPKMTQAQTMDPAILFAPLFAMLPEPLLAPTVTATTTLESTADRTAAITEAPSATVTTTDPTTVSNSVHTTFTVTTMAAITARTAAATPQTTTKATRSPTLSLLFPRTTFPKTTKRQAPVPTAPLTTASSEFLPTKRKYRISWAETTSEEEVEEEPQKPTEECKDTLATISDPVTHNKYGRNEGAWMKDPKAHDNRIYVTNYYYGNNLLEFRNMEVFKQGRFTKSYKLPYNWIGTGHVVYDGAFFYNRAFSRDIIKFDLRMRYVAAWTMLHDAVFEEATPWKWRGHSDIDFAVDESGLWVIYPAIDEEGFQREVIVLSKLNPDDLSIQKETSWRTGLRKDYYGNCFVVCGVLYAVDKYNQMNANISYAFDTHTNTQMIPRLPFTNNYTYTTQIDYNPKDRVLYAWDNGHQVTYDVIFAY